MALSDEKAGLVGAVRQKAIGWPDLANMEKHGKREDASGQRRQVRDDAPLVFDTLDLAEARKAHMEGVKQSGRSACIHALVQFPTGLLDGASERDQQAMLNHAVGFLNGFHGGDAVFAARLDRDEKGRHTVDAFLLPRYEFRYKDGRTARKASVSKFSKAEAKRRFDKDDRRSQGSALQDAFYEHLRDKMGLEGVLPPERKKATTQDRLEPEELALKKYRQKLQDNARSLLRADRAARKRNVGEAAKLAQERMAFAAEQAEAIPALVEAQRLAERQGDRTRADKLKSLLSTLKHSKGASTKLKPIRVGRATRIVDEAFKVAGDESR